METRFPHIKPQEEIDAEDRPLSGPWFIFICALGATVFTATWVVADLVWPF